MLLQHDFFIKAIRHFTFKMIPVLDLKPHSSYIASTAGILEPLTELKRLGKITTDMCLILIDSLNEAEFHKPDYGDTIASFLTKHIVWFPSWLKVVATVRTAFQDIAKLIPFQRLSLDLTVPPGDCKSANDYISKDIEVYLNYRIGTAADLKQNIAPDGKPDTAMRQRFVAHVQMLTQSCFLYCKLLLNLIENGHLVVKSTNYKILPVTLAEVFILMLNLRFPTVRSFEQVAPLFEVCLASLYPLTLSELFSAVSSAYVRNHIEWKDFLRRISTVSGFLLLQRDGSYMFFHPAFREWLFRREDKDTSPKFPCDLRYVCSCVDV